MFLIQFPFYNVVWPHFLSITPPPPFLTRSFLTTFPRFSHHLRNLTRSDAEGKEVQMEVLSDFLYLLHSCLAWRKGCFSQCFVFF